MTPSTAICLNSPRSWTTLFSAVAWRRWKALELRASLLGEAQRKRLPGLVSVSKLCIVGRIETRSLTPGAAPLFSSMVRPWIRPLLVLIQKSQLPHTTQKKMNNHTTTMESPPVLTRISELDLALLDLKAKRRGLTRSALVREIVLRDLQTKRKQL